MMASLFGQHPKWLRSYLATLGGSIDLMPSVLGMRGLPGRRYRGSKPNKESEDDEVPYQGFI